MSRGALWSPATLDDPSGVAKELRILDLWNNMDGFGRFFSDPQVQAGGAMIFASRDPVVWTPSDHEDFMLPTPKTRTERYVGMIRGTVRSRAAAKTAFDGAMRDSKNAARMLGQISHQSFYRRSRPGEPASDELLGIDVWHDAEGMRKFYAETTPKQGLYSIFTGPPVASVWKQPAGSWVEW